METVKTHGTFEQTIAQADERLQEVARKLRAVIIDVYPEVVEVPWPKQQITCYGIGPKKMSQHFCYIGAHSQHVNLGFNYGSQLPDPAGMLEGSGKKYRHVKIRDATKLEQAALRALLVAAVQERLDALDWR